LDARRIQSLSQPEQVARFLHSESCVRGNQAAGGESTGGRFFLEGSDACLFNWNRGNPDERVSTDAGAIENFSVEGLIWDQYSQH